MPRKAKPGSGVIRIEGLSEPGKATAQPQRVEYDDFTGEPIPIAAPEPPQGPIAPDHRKIKHANDKLENDMKLSLLVRLGIVKDQPNPIPPKPKLAHNQRLVKIAGEERVMTVVNPNPFPRRF